MYQYSSLSSAKLLQLGKNPSCSCSMEFVPPVRRPTLTKIPVSTMRFGRAFGFQAKGANVTMLVDLLCFTFVIGLYTSMNCTCRPGITLS